MEKQKGVVSAVEGPSPWTEESSSPSLDPMTPGKISMGIMSIMDEFMFGAMAERFVPFGGR